MEALNSKKRFPILEVAKINLKYNAFLSVAVAFAFLLLVPIMVGTANLDSYTSAVPLEMFVSLIGIVLLTPVFQPEQSADICDLVSSKYVSIAKIYLVRTIYSVIIIAIFVGLFSVYMSIRGCDMNLRLAVGTFADAVFLGAMGMITSSLCNNTVIAYMIPTVFYALNYGAGGKLKNYYLFSMTSGQFEPKLWLLITGILFIAVSIVFREVQRKFR